MHAYSDAMASKSDPARRRAPSKRNEGAAALLFDPLGGGVVVAGGGDPVDVPVGGVPEDGEGDVAVGGVGVVDGGELVGVGDGGELVGEGDGAVPLLFEVGEGDGAVPLLFAAATVTVSFMPPEQCPGIPQI